MAKNWVIPDIHGCHKTLQSLIEYQISPSKHDRLYFLGDYIDRGPASRQVIDYIMHLQEEGYRIYPLMGNHEDYMLKAYNEALEQSNFMGIRSAAPIRSAWKFIGARETLQSFGIKNPAEIPEKYIAWLKGLKLYIELDKHILVHAGLNFETGDPFSDEQAMLWIRDFKPQPEKIRNKTVIHGHMPINLELIYHLKDNPSHKVIDLDNGIYMKNVSGFGNLVAMELGSGDLATQYNLDL